jgi:hypothetical protein
LPAAAIHAASAVAHPARHAFQHSLPIEIAQVNGFGARYEVVGDAQARVALTNFYRILLQHHTFSTGGHGWYEHWYPEDSLGDAITDVRPAAITTARRLGLAAGLGKARSGAPAGRPGGGGVALGGGGADVLMPQASVPQV